MKKFFLYIILCVATLSACDDDGSSSSNLNIDDRLFVGEWIWFNSDGTCYTDIDMKNSLQANYAVYKSTTGNKPAYIEDTGTWKWYSERAVLSLNFFYERPPYYEIVEIDDTHMVLHNLGYNTTETYYRVVETLNLEEGQIADIDYLQSHQGSVKSSNLEIAAINAEGKVEGVLDGVAFLEINVDGKIVYAKAIVRGRTARFKEETHLLSDDIIAKYGEPNLVVEYNSTQMAMQYLNPKTADPDLYALQYRYHKDTHQIFLIQTIYPATSEAAFTKDWQFIAQHYYQQQATGNVYGEFERYRENTSLIYVIGESGGLYWINYGNQDYVE